MSMLLLFVMKCFAVLLAVCGALVNGPYCLITTAVSADLGTHPSLHGNSMALATVTAIIDGTGSMGLFHEHINAFNVRYSKLLLFEGLSAILV